MKKEFDAQFKIVLVGDEAVGKSCLMHQYASHQFSQRYVPTVSVDTANSSIDIKGNHINVGIWDVSSHPRYSNINAIYYKHAHAFIFVYDITSHHSFHKVKELMQQVERYPGLRALVANKRDLQNSRQVSRLSGAAFAGARAMIFREISANHQGEVEELMKAVLNELAKDLQPKNEPQQTIAQELSEFESSPQQTIKQSPKQENDKDFFWKVAGGIAITTVLIILIKRLAS